MWYFWKITVASAADSGFLGKGKEFAYKKLRKHEKRFYKLYFISYRFYKLWM